MENRFLRNLSHGAKVTYLQLFGREVPMRGSWWPGLPDSDRTVHSSWAPKWSMPFTKTIHTLLQLLRPTVVVINLGHHLHTPLHAQELQSMGDSFARLNGNNCLGHDNAVHEVGSTLQPYGAEVGRGPYCILQVTLWTDVSRG